MNGGPVVAVTGATGFLGRHLVAALAREGMRIRILARHSPAYTNLRYEAPLDIVLGSLEDAQALDRLSDGADALIHVAGLIKAHDRATFLRVNRDGTRAVAEALLRRAPTARFIAISSLAAREPQLSDYAASKRAGEAAARGVYRESLDRLVIIRPPAIYGPGDRETLTIFKAASRVVAPVLGGRIALIHVRDAAAAVAKLAIGPDRPGVYALADPRPSGYVMAEILSEAARAMGKAGAWRGPRLIPIPAGIALAAGTASAWWGRLSAFPPIFTPGKARELLHPDWSVTPGEALPPAIYQSQIGISEGFRETVAWYREAGWLP